ncbi:hypothetical protein AK830_g1308 [Neonectria ditissima]|uniref:Nephrocystin 3-like N-terminal domain-containing protein n=1 Tax=Neonectria ditissima TaxID=78410 RepID=A0A0P7BNA8_9HYPO|nr:hypothetical protein AK830_g1308 [Neonectria ditissima]
MADPLSIAGSIAGLISISDAVFRGVYKYTKAVKNAQNDVGTLANEINSLGADLRHLYALADELESGDDVFDPTLRAHHLGRFYKTLNSIKERVDKADARFARSKLISMTQQLKWPFSVQETKELLGELSRHKQSINVALSADTLRKLQLNLFKIDELSQQVTSIDDAVKRIEINTQINIDSPERKILDYFMEISPRPRLDTSVNLRHPMTGLWLTNSPRFLQWLETPNSKIWLSGIPGAGKTVLAGAVVQEALTRSHITGGVAVAYFFCDYKDSGTGSPVNILGAIAHQLALQKPEAFEILRQYYDELHLKTHLPKKPDPLELRAKICKMAGLFDQTTIIVDGLDECGDNTADVVEILVELSDYSTNLSMALFSRDHFDIRVHLEKAFDHVPIAAHTDDIKLYVSTELEKRTQTGRLRISDLQVKDEIMETLVRGEKGMFRWVVCQLDYLGNCAHDRERLEALKKLPPTLSESYRRLLERLNSCSSGVQKMVQMCLQFLAFSPKSLPIPAFRQAVSTPETLGARLEPKNTVSEEEIMHRCSSLIRKSENGKFFEFAHFSVKEFLVDEKALSETADRPSLSMYFISESGCQALLAAQCLRFLQLKNFDQPPAAPDQQIDIIDERNNTYPFYRYAVQDWLLLTKDGFHDQIVLNLAKSLFNPAKTTYFVNWAVDAFIFASSTMAQYEFEECLIELLEGGSWEKSTLELLQFLQSSDSFHFGWGLRLGRVTWDMAVREGFSYVKGVLLFDERIRLSREALGSQASTAVNNGDEKELKGFLADTCLEKSAPIKADGSTMLHMSVRQGSLASIQILLDAGCDPCIEDAYGDLPLHKVVGRRDTSSTSEILQLFAERHISLLSSNKSGHTIWHMMAEKDPREILQYFADKTSDVMVEALSMRDHAGKTPLSLVFETSQDSFTETLISIVGLSTQIPGFWNYHGPIIGAAARWGSESVVRCLLEAGAKPEPALPETLSPLHNLGSQTSPGCVKLLQELYPHAREQRFEGQLPIEHYITQALRNQRNPNSEVIRALTSPDVVSNADHNGRTLWDFACSLPGVVASKGDKSSQQKAEGFSQTLAALLEVNAMTAWEDRNNEFGLVPLVSDILKLKEAWIDDFDTDDSSEKATLFISADTVCQAITRTRFWPSAKASRPVVGFLKAAIEDNNVEVATVLILGGVSIHQPCEGLSAIEVACESFIAGNICASEGDRNFMVHFLDRSGTFQLNRPTPDKDGLRLLHRTATRSFNANVPWLIQELISRGADINGKALRQGGRSVLAHHVRERSFQSAGLLLKLGADPTVDTKDSGAYDCAIEAILNGNANFLQALLVYVTEHQFVMDWGRKFPSRLTIQQEKILFNGMNALHLASMEIYRADCLKFYLDEGLVPDVDVACKEGLTPLHVAASGNNLEAMQILISRGAVIMAETKDASTPLHLATRNNHLEATALLLEHGAKETVDVFGKSPRFYAKDQSYECITNILDQSFGTDDCLNPMRDSRLLSAERERAQSTSFEQVISDVELDKCNQLLANGCSIEVELPIGTTALLFSLSKDRPEVANWLISHGANVRKATMIDNQWTTVIELGALKESCVGILPLLFEEYLNQGGDLVRGNDYPLHRAVDKGNIEGLRVLLDCVKEYIGIIAQRSQLSPQQAESAILNRLHEENGATPLHTSVSQCNKTAVSLLIEKGADINVTNRLGVTPFESSPKDIEDHTASFFACDTSIFSRIRTELIDEWQLMLPLGQNPQILSSNKSESSDLNFAILLEITENQILCNEHSVDLETACKFRWLGYDLTQEDGAGRSLMHCLICREDLSHLVLKDDFGLFETTAFPWHLNWYNFRSIAFLTSRFLEFQRCLLRETFRKILNLEPERGWSPLCLAARYSSTEILQNCLSMGAEINFEGSPLGSALVVACAYGWLDCVRFLVRRQAAVSYTGKRGLMNAPLLTRSKLVRHWFLVGRFNEQLRISSSDSALQSDCNECEDLKSWSGIVQVKFRLYGKMGKMSSESPLEYVNRVGDYRKQLQGEVISLPGSFITTFAVHL